MTPATMFVAHSSEVSGAEQVLLALAALAVERGDDVTVACPQGRLADGLPDGVRHVLLPSLTLGGLPWPLALCHLAARTAVAARRLRAVATPSTRVVVNSMLALPAVRLMAPASKATWLVHDTVHRGDQALVARLAGRGLRRAVAVSEATAAPLRRLGLPVLVRPNGVPWPVDPVDLTVPQRPVLGQLGLLTPWKGHRVLLDAVAQLPGVHLELAGGHFAGDAAYAEQLRCRAAEPDLFGRVTFLGHVEASSALRRWHVAVSASTSPEACPLSVLEAMSLGLPVVGTDHGGTSELLRSGAGLLVPPGDVQALVGALRRLLHDTCLRRSTSATARQVVAQRHDRSRTLPAMLDALVAG